MHVCKYTYAYAYMYILLFHLLWLIVTKLFVKCDSIKLWVEGNHISVEGALETNSRGCNSQYRGVMMWPLIVNNKVIRDAKGNGKNMHIFWLHNFCYVCYN